MKRREFCPFRFSILTVEKNSAFLSILQEIQILIVKENQLTFFLFHGKMQTIKKQTAQKNQNNFSLGWGILTLLLQALGQTKMKLAISVSLPPS